MGGKCTGNKSEMFSLVKNGEWLTLALHADSASG